MRSFTTFAVLCMLSLGGIASVAADGRMAAGMAKIVASELTHWLTTSSGVRHNSSCRHFKNSKGRMCTKDEGRACKVCGG